MYKIYKVTNLINNKVYIGITSKTIEERFSQHCHDSYAEKDDFPFHYAIKKYGKENFKIEEIESVPTEEEAKEKEIYYIGFYDSYIKNGKGYNATFGGDSNQHLKGEDSPVSKLTNEQFYKIINLLKTTVLTATEIYDKAGIKWTDKTLVQKEVSDINQGDTFRLDDETYPLRYGRSTSKQGINNHFAKLNEQQVKEIIELLEKTDYSQTEIAKKYGVHSNTINFINRCITWKYLHNYKNNIRTEYKNEHKQ
jgi:group I intron endonuclease